MNKKITAKDVKIMAELQRTLPMTKRPFKSIAEKIGLTESEVIEKTREYGEKKYYRRFGATLRHQKAGFTANGMGIWAVPAEEERRGVGETLAAYHEVSHAYERPSFEDWPYHIFTMIHGESEDEVRRIAKGMSEDVGITDYDVLFSTREFKKTSMQYFDHWPLEEKD
ncbi:Siroheme decarboxylase AhbB, alternate heme biosynthesis pathway [hydrothermal vent metagenome]|uniref:siroheme decarboxylase n=1 Tax=hydrothermal vent metagenome TaxID=652676 RepID=A0A3B1C5C8_9ZZZZ